MFLIERSVLPPRSCPRTSDASASDGPAIPGTSIPGTAVPGTAVPGISARTPPVPATFLERAAGGAFELLPRRHFAGAGAVIQAALSGPLLPDPLLAGLTRGRPEGSPESGEAVWRAMAPLPPVTPPQAPRLRRSA